MFHIGQKVVCITRKSLYPNYIGRLRNPPLLKVGGIYTIREIDLRYIDLVGQPGVRLEELRFPPRESVWGMTELALAMSRFRPIIERKTDISVFTDMLLRAPTKETIAVSGDD